MKNIKIMGLLLACLITAYTGKAYARNNSQQIKVGVYVRGDENLNDVIENYMNKELSNLGNVIVAFSQLDCAIDILVKKLNDGNNNAKNGCALSVTIIDRFDSYAITRVVEELDTLIPKIRAQPIVIKRLEDLSKELVGIAISTTKIKSYQESFLYTGRAGQLRELCSRIVKDFNNEYLENKRKVIQREYY